MLVRPCTLVENRGLPFWSAMTLDELQVALGHRFERRELLVEALTHKTWAQEERDRSGRRVPDQQRLEFLGDAFLGLEVGWRLFLAYPEADPGRLTKLRIALTKGAHAAQVGQRLGLLELVRAGAGERQNLDRNGQVLEDTVEALIGAVLLDAGEDRARSVIQRHFPLDAAEAAAGDPIARFTERWQAEHRGDPPASHYVSSGPDHERRWTATVHLPDGRRVCETARSKKEARRKACAAALDLWE